MRSSLASVRSDIRTKTSRCHAIPLPVGCTRLKTLDDAKADSKKPALPWEDNGF